MNNLKSLIKGARCQQQLADEATSKCLDALRLVCKDQEAFEKAEEALLIYIFDGTDCNDHDLTLNGLMKNIEGMIA